MVDRGPVLTSAIIFYLSIGAAIFQVLEEPNWKTATENFRLSKEKILSKYQCLNREVLEDIVEEMCLLCLSTNSWSDVRLEGGLIMLLRSETGSPL